MKRSAQEMASGTGDAEGSGTIMAQFITPEGVPCEPKLSLPRSITPEQLNLVLNQHILKNEESLPYSFFVKENEIVEQLWKTLQVAGSSHEEETILPIIYQPQAVFRVKIITHCTSSLEGHTEAILTVSFSPDGQRLATGSGDTTIRLWDVQTNTPYAECKGHTNWVLTLAWSPDGRRLISGSMDKTVRLWNPDDGKLLQTFTGHKGYITSLSWQPLHREAVPSRFVSSSKDGTARVWMIGMKTALLMLGGHSKSVTVAKWGGAGFIYTASQDTNIIVWNDNNGKVVRVLKGHGHWVNTLALNTDYVLRTGSYDHTGKTFETPEEAQARAQERYDEVKGSGSEILVSGSDDCTVMVWYPEIEKKPRERLTGHGKLINLVSFSPNGQLFATASFDKNLKLWSSSGKYLTTFRGHVSEVYQVCWSSDSRMFVSGSKDSTMKVWDTRKKKMVIELPGHADEVYSVDWSPDGQYVASGSKDRLLKLWRN